MPGWLSCLACNCRREDNDPEQDVAVEQKREDELYQKADTEEAIASYPSNGEMRSPKNAVVSDLPQKLEAYGSSQRPGVVFEQSSEEPTKASSGRLEGSPSSASIRSASKNNADMSTPSSLLVNSSSFHTSAFTDDMVEDVKKIISEANELRLSGYIFNAEKMILELTERLRAEGKFDILSQVEDTAEYRELVRELEEVNRLLTTLLDDEGWTLQKEADKTLVWTKPEPGTDLVTVRMAGLVEGPFDNFCSIGKEVALIKTWMPGVKTSGLVKQLNVFDHIGYYVWQCPVPLVKNREFLVEETNMINDNEAYTIARRQPPYERKGVDLPVSQKGAIRAAISNWCSFSAPCGDRKIFCVTVLNVDLKMPLPPRLINYLSISMGFQSFSDLRKNVQKSLNPDSELGRCVKDPNNNSFYDRMRSLEKIRETKAIPCRAEILRTGWVKDPADRKKIFNRSSGVLVPML